MTPEELKAMIMKDFIAEVGLINIDPQDMKNIRDASDILDGCRKVCCKSEIKDCLQLALNELMAAHPDEILSNLAVNLHFSNEAELMMEEMSVLHEVLDTLDDVEIIWGISRNNNEGNGENFIICIFAGFKLDTK